MQFTLATVFALATGAMAAPNSLSARAPVRYLLTPISKTVHNPAFTTQAPILTHGNCRARSLVMSRLRLCGAKRASLSLKDRTTSWAWATFVVPRQDRAAVCPVPTMPLFGYAIPPTRTSTTSTVASASTSSTTFSTSARRMAFTLLMLLLVLRRVPTAGTFRSDTTIARWCMSPLRFTAGPEFLLGRKTSATLFV